MSVPHIIITLIYRNGSEWWRIRSEFQKGLSSPSNVRSFLPDTDEITKEFASKLVDTQIGDDVPDFLVILSRLNLERNGVSTIQDESSGIIKLSIFSALPHCLRCANE